MSAKGDASRSGCESPADARKLNPGSLPCSEPVLRGGSATRRGSRSTRRQCDSSRTKPPSNRKIHSRSRNGRHNRNGRSVCCSWYEILGAGHSARAHNPRVGELVSRLARQPSRKKLQFRAPTPQSSKRLRLFSGLSHIPRRQGGNSIPPPARGRSTAFASFRSKGCRVGVQPLAPDFADHQGRERTPTRLASLADLPLSGRGIGAQGASPGRNHWLPGSLLP
jgi:hypothetical protein